MTPKSIFDIEENLVAAFSYLLGPLSGIFVLVMERENKLVRFHALQSTLWFLMLMVAGWVLTAVGGLLGWIPLIGTLVNLVLGLVGGLISLVYIVSKVYLIYKAYQSDMYKVPIIGEAVWKQINK